MDLTLQADGANRYKSPSQRTRLLSEHWVGGQAYCANCGSEHITAYPNNSRTQEHRHCLGSL